VFNDVPVVFIEGEGVNPGSTLGVINVCCPVNPEPKLILCLSLLFELTFPE
jgi:hypothetical protein